jgi:hypothetical protein
MVGMIVLIGVLAVAIYGVAAAGRGDKLPFRGESFAYVTSEGIVDGSDCPFFEVNVEGYGTATHVGAFTIVRQHCFTPPDHPAFDPDKGVIHDGTYEITAENGDTLWGTYSGSLEPTEFGDDGPTRGIIRGPNTIDGGTGRFTGAEGRFMEKGDYDLVADEGHFKFEGRIDY